MTVFSQSATVLPDLDTVNTSGGDAVSQTGSVAYSLGSIFYASLSSNEIQFNESVQQATGELLTEEISEESIEEVIQENAEDINAATPVGDDGDIELNEGIQEHENQLDSVNTEEDEGLETGNNESEIHDNMESDVHNTDISSGEEVEQDLHNRDNQIETPDELTPETHSITEITSDSHNEVEPIINSENTPIQDNVDSIASSEQEAELELGQDDNIETTEESRAETRSLSDNNSNSQNEEEQMIDSEYSSVDVDLQFNEMDAETWEENISLDTNTDEKDELEVRENAQNEVPDVLLPSQDGNNQIYHLPSSNNIDTIERQDNIEENIDPSLPPSNTIGNNFIIDPQNSSGNPEEEDDYLISDESPEPIEINPDTNEELNENPLSDISESDTIQENNFILDDGWNNVDDANQKILIARDHIYDTNNDLQDNIEQLEIVTYPNPVTEYVKIKIINYNEQLTWLELYDLQGQMILKKSIESSLTNVPLGYLSAGTYLLRIFIQPVGYRSFKLLKK